MARNRKEVVNLILSWEGKKESDGSFKPIIDIYNSYKDLPRKTKMQYNWAWCACTWSAVAIKLGYTDIMPIEISCGQLIEAAKKMNCWQENDGYIAQPGDGVLYDWNDSGIGDNTGWPDHIGIIVETNDKSGYFIVVEGNYNNAVKRRKLAVNANYIRGFITPKYDKVETSKVTATCYAKNFDNKLAGTYTTTANLYLRNDAGTSNKALCLIPKNTQVRCYGYYSIANNVKWLYIQTTVNGTVYTGFSSSTYLKR